MVCDPFTDTQSFKDSPNFNPFHLRMSSQSMLNDQLGAIDYLVFTKISRKNHNYSFLRHYIIYVEVQNLVELNKPIN